MRAPRRQLRYLMMPGKPSNTLTQKEADETNQSHVTGVYFAGKQSK
jgi:hypothetical protein